MSNIGLRDTIHVSSSTTNELFASGENKSVGQIIYTTATANYVIA